MWFKLKSLWQSSSLSRLGGAPYAVDCRCGTVMRGWRLRTHQVLRCRQCGAAVFVLGQSPLPAVGKRSLTASALPLLPLVRPGRRWLAVMGAVLLVAVLGSTGLWLLLPASKLDTVAAPDAGAVRQHLSRGEKHLANGAFRQAIAELTAARRAWHNDPQLLTPAEGRHLEQLWRQASVLVDLSGATLEEILHHASTTAEAEWALEFAQRYQGKAFLFDLTIRSVAGKHFEHPYRLWVHQEPARLDLDQLELLPALPLDPPRRVLFAARLKSVRREADLGWVIQLVPDSGLLLTDAGAARMCCPALGDPEAQTLLEQQRLWLQEAGGSDRK
jgi:hypothetical protein